MSPPRLIGPVKATVSSWGHERFDVATTAGRIAISREAVELARLGVNRRPFLQELHTELQRLGCLPREEKP